MKKTALSAVVALVVLAVLVASAAAEQVVIIGGRGGDVSELEYLQESIPGAIAIAPNHYWPLAKASRDVLRQLKERGIVEKLILIGHSWGGLISRQIDAENPGLVRKIVTIGTPNGGFWYAPRFVYGVDDTKSFTPIYVIAGITGEKKWYLSDKNDGTIDLSSVMDVGRPIEDSAVFAGLSHVGLLTSPEVVRQINFWISK